MTTDPTPPRPRPDPRAFDYDHADVERIVLFALDEDLRSGGDLTCRALVPAGARLRAVLTAKEAGVVCGLELFRRVARLLGSDLAVTRELRDGERVTPGTVVWAGEGDATGVLIAERTALNLVQRLSGTATMARRFADAVAGTRAGIYDTRKTTPGLRLLQKHAVVAGGGRNHRIGLYDQVLIKENHIALMPPGREGSSPAEAVRVARERLGPDAVIEVEIEELSHLAPCMRSGADIVLCDNMTPAELREAVRIRDLTPNCRACDLEASGGITLDTVRAYAETGIERISVGALTHSAPGLDLSLRCTVA
jgi:nicotinate-nucleotide pyrophosphorylase (carboxylating)